MSVSLTHSREACSIFDELGRDTENGTEGAIKITDCEVCGCSGSFTWESPCLRFALNAKLLKAHAEVEGSLLFEDLLNGPPVRVERTGIRREPSFPQKGSKGLQCDD